jgi:hypothetical protein
MVIVKDRGSGRSCCLRSARAFSRTAASEGKRSLRTCSATKRCQCSDSGTFTSGSTALKLWELSPTRHGQRLLKIDHGLLTHSEEPLLGTVEIGDQRHDRREREDEREERQ